MLKTRMVQPIQCPHCHQEFTPPRPRRTAKGVAYRAAAIAGLAALLFGLAFTYWSLLADSGRKANRLANRKPPPKANASAGEKPSASDRMREWQDAVVKLEGDSPADLGSTGVGVVIDPRGLIATNYHVISASTRAKVRLHNGATYDVAGYVAVRPETDLALLQLRDPPPHLRALPIARAEPAVLAPVIAIGHPRGGDFSVQTGIINGVVEAHELSGPARHFVSRLLSGSADVRWLRHTARLTDGFSGGPLLGENGDLLGLNTWVDDQSHVAYALPAQYLNELRQQRLPEIVSLERFARRDAQAAALAERLTGERIDELLREIRKLGWLPSSEQDYALFQELAWAVTLANSPDTLLGPLRRGGLDDDRVRGLVQAADRAVTVLRKQRWDGPGQITFINDFAAPRVREPWAGVFFFAAIERLVEGADDRRGVLVKVAGIDQTLYLPLDGTLITPRAGSQCLVLGVNFDGQQVRFGENPLQPTVAPVIASRTLLPLE